MALPEHQVGELIGGVLRGQPRPPSPHAHAATRLGIALGSPFYRGMGGSGGLIILYEPELHLDADIVVPDLAGWRRERMPEEAEVPFLSLAPDWVCEVSSVMASVAGTEPQALEPFEAMLLKLEFLWGR